MESKRFSFVAQVAVEFGVGLFGRLCIFCGKDKMKVF